MSSQSNLKLHAGVSSSNVVGHSDHHIFTCMTCFSPQPASIFLPPKEAWKQSSTTDRPSTAAPEYDSDDEDDDDYGDSIDTVCITYVTTTPTLTFIQDDAEYTVDQIRYAMLGLPAEVQEQIAKRLWKSHYDEDDDTAHGADFKRDPSAHVGEKTDHALVRYFKHEVC